MFRMLVEIHEEQEEIDGEYDDEIWFDDLDQKILSFKHKVHNRLKEGEKIRKSDQVSKCSSKSSPEHSSKSSPSAKSRSSTKAKATEEKEKVAELMMEASFMKKRRDAGYQTRSLKVEKELAKAQARAEIYENESKIGQSRKRKLSTPNDVHTNQGISTTEDLDETEQKEVQNEKWKKIFKTQLKSEPSYLAVISDADSRRHMRKLCPSWSNDDGKGVSHSSNAVILPILISQ